jgi:hypothetical protein
MPYITDNISPESFYQYFSEQEVAEEDFSFTEEDIQEIEIYRCPLCDNEYFIDQHGNHKISICEEHQKYFNIKLKL